MDMNKSVGEFKCLVCNRPVTRIPYRDEAKCTFPECKARFTIFRKTDGTLALSHTPWTKQRPDTETLLSTFGVEI
ncbi:MAG TPA: hypothetical protein DCG34_08900 [Clostridiales bacterium]|nr:hypothetical protein [Clostridiales bacterium]